MVSNVCQHCDGKGYATLFGQEHGAPALIHVTCGGCCGLGAIRQASPDAWRNVTITPIRPSHAQNWRK